MPLGRFRDPLLDRPELCDCDCTCDCTRTCDCARDCAALCARTCDCARDCARDCAALCARDCARDCAGVPMLKCSGPLFSRFDRALASSLANSGPAPSCGPFDCFRELDDCREAAGVPGLDGFFGAAGVAALDDFREVAGVAGLGGFGGPGEGSSFEFGGGSVGFGGFFGFDGFLGCLDAERPREDDDEVDCARTLFSSASTSSSLGFGGSLCSDGTISMLGRVFFAGAERARGALASLFGLLGGCAGSGSGSGFGTDLALGLYGLW